MQHQLQVGGGGASISDEEQKLGDLGIAEAASPISSRPPAPAAMGNLNLEEMMAEGGSATSNRWPRQETLALLQIKSEMETAFRDATLKGPLWEQVSRKLGDLGYKRSAKKCKEKFENVHKYYKRTKEGRGGRQDGKSYKFFSQLEALHHTTTTVATPPSYFAAATTSFPPHPVMMIPQQKGDVASHHIRNDSAAALFGISFSSDSSSEGEDDDNKDMDEDVDVEELGDEQRKRKRKSSGNESEEKMMDFFEGLLKQVMQKHETMQQRFLEAIEKREKDRMIREEAWKRQDMARIAREHDLIAQERAVSASRDAAIIDFLQKITGQTIQLLTPDFQPQQQHLYQYERREHQPPPILDPHSQTAEQIPAEEKEMPLQDLATETSSSRWPKAEVLQLIKIRSSMEARYQEAGPKGPLWEEISAEMGRVGCSRNAKRCKEKWENINKYFKKVKESNKKRHQDAKTCPYFNELDALYRKRILSSSHISINASTQRDVGMLPPQSLGENVSVDKAAELQTSHSNIGREKQPEDMLNKGSQQISTRNNCNGVRCSNSDDLDDDIYKEVDENEEAYDDKTEEEMTMVFKTQFQRQIVDSSNGCRTSTFVAMVK